MLSQLRRSFRLSRIWNAKPTCTLWAASSLNTHNLQVDCWRRYKTMHSIIYLVGLVVVVLFILSFLGLR
jgi:hypothetical protein